MIKCHCSECGHSFERIRRRGAMTVCTPCADRKRVREWKRTNPDRTREHSGYAGSPESKQKYAKSDRGKEIGRIRSLRWYWKNPEHAREISRSLYASDRDRHIQRVVNRSKRLSQATPIWSDLDVSQIFIRWLECSLAQQESNIRLIIFIRCVAKKCAACTSRPICKFLQRRPIRLKTMLCLQIDTNNA